MRREEFEIAGASPGLRLYPETDSESSPTQFESAVLAVLVKSILGEREGEVCARSARIVLRVISDYGADIHLDLQQLRAVSPEAPAGDMITAHFLAECWSEEATIRVPWRQSTIGAWLQAKRDGAAAIDIYPHDGENIGRDQCERLLFESAAAISITAR